MLGGFDGVPVALAEEAHLLLNNWLMAVRCSGFCRVEA